MNLNNKKDRFMFSRLDDDNPLEDEIMEAEEGEGDEGEEEEEDNEGWGQNQDIDFDQQDNDFELDEHKNAQGFLGALETAVNVGDDVKVAGKLAET